MFDGNNDAGITMIAQAIAIVKKIGDEIGLSNHQDPADFPAFSQFIPEHGIGSISFTPDALPGNGLEKITRCLVSGYAIHGTTPGNYSKLGTVTSPWMYKASS